MNDTTSASGASLLPEGTAALTTVHFVLIAVLALLAIAGIIWGIRQKRGRVQAGEDIVAHAEEAGVLPVEPEAEDRAEDLGVARPAAPASQPVPAAPVPVAPAPPPIADAPVPGAPATTDRLVDEPIAAAAPLDASPAAEAIAPAPASPADGPVTQLKGLGPKVAARLAELGVTTVGQIAALDETRADALDAQLGTFAGRMRRDRWLEQARLLAAGDRAGFEAAFGRL